MEATPAEAGGRRPAAPGARAPGVAPRPASFGAPAASAAAPGASPAPPQIPPRLTPYEMRQFLKQSQRYFLACRKEAFSVGPQGPAAHSPGAGGGAAQPSARR